MKYATTSSFTKDRQHVLLGNHYYSQQLYVSLKQEGYVK